MSEWNQNQFEREFTDRLFRDIDKLEVKEAWESRAKEAGLELPERGDMPLARYVWNVRAIVVEHQRTQEPEEDTVAAIERCRMHVHPYGPDTKRDHGWFAVASILGEDGSEVDTVEGDGQTPAEAVAMCARLYDKADPHALEGK